MFGEEPVVVLAEGDLQRLMLTANLVRLLRLEGACRGRCRRGRSRFRGPAPNWRDCEPVEFVAGPATFLNEAVIQIDRQLRRLAATGAARPAARIPARGRGPLRDHQPPQPRQPRLRRRPSSSTCAAPRGTPKARLAYLFPNSHSAQIVVRLRPDLSEADATGRWG